MFSILLISCSDFKEREQITSVNNEAEEISDSDSLISVDKGVYKLPVLPKELFFAGEKIPLDNEEVKTKLMRELIINSNRHSKTLILLREKNYWESHIKGILTENNVPEDFFYLAIAESELDNDILSPVKAAGMWQLMKATAREYGMIVNGQIDERRNPDKATKVACEYLKKAKEKFGTWSTATASYNRGMGGIERALKNQKVKSVYDLYLNKETSRYLYRILALKILFENPEIYGFHINDDELVKPIAVKKELLPKGKYSTVDLAKKHNMTFVTLRKYNPWIIDASSYQLNNKSDKLWLTLPID